MCYLTVLGLGFHSFKEALTTPKDGTTSRPPSVSKLQSRFATSIDTSYNLLRFSSIFQPTLESCSCDDSFLDELFKAVVALCSVANIQSEKIFTPDTSSTVRV